MYSPLVVEKRLRALELKGHKFFRHSVADSIEIAGKLEKKRQKQLESKSKSASSPVFASDESAFIRSEILLSKYDFRYFAERYGSIELDASAGGGVAPISFWASQDRTLNLIAAREEELEAEYEKHGFSDALLIVWHKCRQEGATALGRLISMHRFILHKNNRQIAASLDEAKKHELYVKDKVVLDNLPFFLKPRMEFDVKDFHLGLELLKSRLTYQMANQEAGIGTGQQFDTTHFTEVALWPYPDRIKFDFLPAIPQSRKVFVGFESTANGRNNFWHEFTENVRHKVYGYGSWIYSFTPWYIEPKKYRRGAPDGWTLNDHTKAHAEMIERTSAEFCGNTVHPTKDQLYWWESERELYRKDGTLNIFLTNYCATPEESFQHSTRAALPVDTLERMRSRVLPPMLYNLTLAHSGMPMMEGR